MDALFKGLIHDHSLDLFDADGQKEPPKHLFDIDHTTLNAIKVCLLQFIV